MKIFDLSSSVTQADVLDRKFPSGGSTAYYRSKSWDEKMVITMLEMLLNNSHLKRLRPFSYRARRLWRYGVDGLLLLLLHCAYMYKH